MLALTASACFAASTRDAGLSLAASGLMPRLVPKFGALPYSSKESLAHIDTFARSTEYQLLLSTTYVEVDALASIPKFTVQLCLFALYFRLARHEEAPPLVSSGESSPNYSVGPALASKIL
ncbi:hypothetical protein WAI453_011718 [Rhynchosporium graminicola]